MMETGLLNFWITTTRQPKGCWKSTKLNILNILNQLESDLYLKTCFFVDPGRPQLPDCLRHPWEAREWAKG